MRNSIRLSMLLFAVLSSLASWAQNTTVSGRVRNLTTQEGIPAVSVIVKGSTLGTFTDENGNFRINVPKLPVTLIITSVGFELLEKTVTASDASVQIDVLPTTSLGQEVVVSATRSPERILESPVTVERMSSTTLRNIPAPSYYEGISNLKGVDMHTASLTFRTVTTRGFVKSGNTRMNQLIDGMDNQAPGLNFSVGNVVGPTELDVDNIELLAGASSALYGSGGVNGTLLINSKNPFKYQGLSFQVKQGIMHINDTRRNPSPYYDWSVRWAKAIKDKFAFKISGQLVKADDWQADDYSNVRRTSVNSKIVDGDRLSDPNYDGVNMYGDETTQNIRDIANIVQSRTRQGILAATGGQFDILPFLGQLPANPTPAQIAGLFGALPTALQALVPTIQNVLPFYFGLRNNVIGNQLVSRTGYEERALVDYNTINFKVTGGLHYKITPGIEASFNSYLGTGTTVYTGADRYSLKNLKIAQHKLEVRANNWFLRGYTTQENAGDSYNATVLGRLINEAWKPSQDWYPQYIGNYVGARSRGMDDYAAHNAARNAADQGRALPGTEQFNSIANTIKSQPIPRGAKFLDKSDLWSAEGQLNLSDVAGFSNIVETIIGTQWKQYVINSQGTIFADTTGAIKIAEYGGYVQFRKRLLNDVLTLTAAGRYDKHTNFEGRFTPRVTAVVKVAPESNVRLSYQTAYRFPTNQDQYINLNVGSGLLIGFLPSFQEKYGLGTRANYTSESINAYRTGGNPANTSLLQQYQFKDVKPESVTSYELGYKAVLAKRLYLDAYGYFSRYQNFLGTVAVGQSTTGSPTGISNPGTTLNLAYTQNSDEIIKAQGWGLTVEYQLYQRYFLYGNVFSDELKDVPAGFSTFFNAPKYRYNIGLRNENIYKNIGFNVVYKWQDKNFYEGTFVTGTLPSFGTLDAQISLRIPKDKTTFRIGGTNITNKYYRSGYGSPYVGGLYYVSFGYNIF